MAGLCEGGNEPAGSLKAINCKSLYMRPPEASGSLDRHSWSVVKRRWMASATSTRGGPTRGRSFVSDRQGALGEVAEAGMENGRHIDPIDYHKMLENHGTVQNLNKDWKITDLKSSAQKVLRLTLTFNVAPQRVITYSKTLGKHRNVSVTVKNTYTTCPVAVWGC
ncbi:hypothetical protein ANN_06861 [Periplaneta americana]|uniref:Uncharacterized protein n=1 Tax=Periplaneta americana TaxID=6978 RepID=A0ABQ8TFF5_PERAM|nr:hypothetical protein ANN_06861 [Periplaneta americana]